MSFTSRRNSLFTLPETYVETHKRPSYIDYNDLPQQKVPYPANGIIKEEAGRLIPSRYILVLLGFFTFVILTTQRLNLSMSLVAMVNQTALHQNVAGQISATECSEAITYSNETLEVPHKETGYLLWDSETQNHIASASFLGYVLTQTPGGRMSETLGGKQILVFSLIVASFCNILSPLSSDWGPYTLLGVQFVKGLAQGFIHPAVSSLMAKWFPKPEKGFLSSVVLSGYPGGAIIGGLLIGILCNSDFFGGWPLAFYVFGILGLVLAFLIFKFTFNCPEEDVRITESEYNYIINNLDNKDTNKKYKTPWKPIVSTFATWALLVGMFGQYWMTFYFLSVQPTYQGTVLHFSHMENGYLNSLPFIGQMIITWSASFLSDVLINKGYASVDIMRKICNSLSCIGYSFALLGIAYAECDRTYNIIYLVIAVSSVGFGYPGSCIVSLDMTTAFAGTLMGITSTLASTSGFIIPLVLGALLSEEQTLSQWRKVIFISSGIGIVSGVVFALFGSAKLQDWDNPNKSKNLSGTVNVGFDEKPEEFDDPKPGGSKDGLDPADIIIDRL